MKGNGQNEIWGKMQRKLLTAPCYCPCALRDSGKERLGFDAEDPPDVVAVSEGKPGSWMRVGQWEQSRGSKS